MIDRSVCLETKLCGVLMESPVIAASGTFGFGLEYSSLIDVTRIGGIAGEGLTLKGSSGNGGRRVYETYAGIMSSTGMENPGIPTFIDEILPMMRKLGPAVIANLGAATEEEYLQGTELLNEAAIDILELNIACPNVNAGGMAMGAYPETAAYITKKVKGISKHPVMVKLTPMAHDLVGVAEACQDAGADAVSLINTISAMAVDVKTRRPIFDNVYAGLSGPAIRPIALKMVHQVSRALRIPVVGMGGILNVEDALSFLMVGASAIQVGTANFVDPKTIPNIVRELEAFCVENDLENISEIVGVV